MINYGKELRRVDSINTVRNSIGSREREREKGELESDEELNTQSLLMCVFLEVTAVFGCGCKNQLVLVWC